MITLYIILCSCFYKLATSNISDLLCQKFLGPLLSHYPQHHHVDFNRLEQPLVVRINGLEYILVEEWLEDEGRQFSSQMVDDVPQLLGYGQTVGLVNSETL